MRGSLPKGFRDGGDTMHGLQVTEQKPGFLAEVTGIDLAKVPGSNTEDFLQKLHDQYPILIFQEQSLDPHQFLAFARLFGKIEIDSHVQQFAHPNLPELIYLSNRDANNNPDPKSADRGSAWHSDSSYKADPCAHTALYALEVPSRGGGTIFANMYQAYETLSHDIKERIDSCIARHLFSRGPAAGGYIPLTPEQEASLPQVNQPVVLVHPTSGRKALYVNPLHTIEIIGMDRVESDGLLKFLFDHSIAPEMIYHHHWAPRQLVIWDQRCTMHRAEAAFPMAEHRRLMRAKISARAA